MRTYFAWIAKAARYPALTRCPQFGGDDHRSGSQFGSLFTGLACFEGKNLRSQWYRRLGVAVFSVLGSLRHWAVPYRVVLYPSG